MIYRHRLAEERDELHYCGVRIVCEMSGQLFARRASVFRPGEVALGISAGYCLRLDYLTSGERV